MSAPLDAPIDLDASIDHLATCGQSCTTRRSALALGAAAGAVALLSGCSVYGETSADAPVADASGSSSDDEAGGTETDAAESDPDSTDSADDGGSSGGVELAKTADIPVGSGKIFADEGVVVTQPTEGEFVAFSTVCTHQGCAVEKIEDGTINCLCHGSKFKITDGSVSDGPAKKPLPAKKINVDGDTIKLDA